jgi:hypothetical protein
MSKTDLPAKRDSVSLRATYICFRLLNGVPIYEIASNREGIGLLSKDWGVFVQ